MRSTVGIPLLPAQAVAEGQGGGGCQLLAHLEERNAVLLGRGLPYEQRKPMLKQYAMDWRMARTPLINDE